MHLFIHDVLNIAEVSALSEILKRIHTYIYSVYRTHIMCHQSLAVANEISGNIANVGWFDLPKFKMDRSKLSFSVKCSQGKIKLIRSYNWLSSFDWLITGVIPIAIDGVFNLVQNINVVIMNYTQMISFRLSEWWDDFPFYWSRFNIYELKVINWKFKRF